MPRYYRSGLRSSCRRSASHLPPRPCRALSVAARVNAPPQTNRASTCCMGKHILYAHSGTYNTGLRTAAGCNSEFVVPSERIWLSRTEHTALFTFLSNIAGSLSMHGNTFIACFAAHLPVLFRAFLCPEVSDQDALDRRGPMGRCDVDATRGALCRGGLCVCETNPMSYSVASRDGASHNVVRSWWCRVR